MSNIIPPLLSNSPPPMIGAIIDDEDDEFGNFAVVNNFDYKDDDSSISTTEEINIKEIPEIPHLYAVKDIEEARDSDSIREDNVSDTDHEINCNGVQSLPPTPPEISEETIFPSDFEIPLKPFSVSVATIDNQINAFNNLSVKENSVPDVIQVEELSDFDDDFADFNAFTNTPTDSGLEKLSSESLLEKQYPIAQNDVVEDDDFGDFNNYAVDCPNLKSDIETIAPETAENVVLSMFPSVEQETEEFYDEDFILNNPIFCQLKDITDTLALSYQWNKSNCQNFLLQALNIDTRNILYGPRWNESMPRYAATLGFTPLEPVKSETHGETTASQSELVEQTEIPLAEFDWVGSGLTNPLEMTPKKIIEKQQKENNRPEQANEDKKTDTLVPQLQANSDTDSIKSLKFIQNVEIEKTEDDFDDFTSYEPKNDDFTSFQSNRTENETLETWSTLRETQITNQPTRIVNENFESWTSLRETHISNLKVDEPNWLKPTILTPDLPRREVAVSRCEEEEDEFTDFQTGNIVKVPMQELKIDQPKTDYGSNGVSENQSTVVQSVMAEQLQPQEPSILQPVKVENAPTTINWPDPGVTDEELHRFDMFYKPAAVIPKDTSKLNNKIEEEDDWSDFISNQAAQPSIKNNKDTFSGEAPNIPGPKKEEFLVKPPLPFSQNGFSTSLVSNQYVVLNHMPAKTDDLEDEWSDFVSSQPSQESPSRVLKPNIPKLNLDWNGPPQFTSWSASITPNIITNPVAFESFQNFTPLDSDLLRNRTIHKKNPSVVIQPKKSTVPSISTLPDLEFVAPKNRTWKK